MGNKASSTSRVENNLVVVNENDVSLLNTQINNLITTSIVNSAKSCSASISQIQNIKLKDIKVKDDVTITTDQTQSSVLSFECIQYSELRNDISQEIINKIMTVLTENNNVKIIDTLNAISKAKIETKGLPMSIANTSSNDQTVINNTRIEDISRTYINQVVQNTVCNNFKTEDIQNAVSNVNNQQDVSIEKVDVEGKFMAVMSQSQGAELMLKVIQKSDIGNKITTTLIGALDVKKEKTTEIDVKKDVKTESKGENESKDIFATGIDSITGFFTNLFTGKSSWMTYLFLIIIVIVIVVIIIYWMKSKKK